jgi:site-specific recombinase XerD
MTKKKCPIQPNGAYRDFEGVYPEPYQKRGGVWVMRYRVAIGTRRCTIPGEPGSDEFVAAWNAARAAAGQLAPPKDPAKYLKLEVRPGETGKGRTLDWLIAAYFSSPAYEELGARARAEGKHPLNQKKRRDYLTAFANASTPGGRRFGSGPFHHMTRSAIELWLNSIKPVGRYGMKRGHILGGCSVRDAHLSAVRVLFNWAIATELTEHRNPAAYIDRTYQQTSRAPFREEDRRKLHKRFPDFDGMPGLVAEVAFITGARRLDLIEFGDHMVGADGVLRWFEKKGKDSKARVPGRRPRKAKRAASCDLKPFPELRARIKAAAERSERETGVVPLRGTWLRNASGRPFGYGDLGTRWRRWCRAAGIREELKLHGMRSGMAVEMLDAGAELNEISDALNHANLATTQLYLSGRSFEKGAARGRQRLRSLSA